MKWYKDITVSIAVIASVVALSVLSNYSPKNEFNSVAKDIIELCEGSVYTPSCYDEEIPKLMDEGYTMEEAFAVTKEVQRLDESYQYCHVLGHYLSAKETAKDPEKWKDVVARAPLGVCSNGAVHGAFQERFRVESMPERDIEDIAPELDGVCEPRKDWQPTLMGQATCIHALGHLTMYVTQADIHKSVELCEILVEETSNETKRQLCYDGAFMQIYQPLDPEDFALIVGKEIETKEASEEFCSQFHVYAESSCVSESWPLYYEDIQSPDTISLICNRVSTDEQNERCMSAMFFVAMAQSNLSSEWAVDFCSRISSGYRGTCFGNSASRLIEVDSRNVEEALELCYSAEESGSAAPCFDELLKYSGYTFAVGSDEFYELCEGMPERWKGPCLSQDGRERL